MTEQEEDQLDNEGLEDLNNRLTRKLLYWGTAIVFLLVLSQYCTAQVAPVITLDHQYVDKNHITMIGGGVETFKRDQIQLMLGRKSFAINASIQVNELIMLEVQNMSSLQGNGRNSTIALLGGLSKYGFRLRAGAMLGYKGKDISPVVKIGYSVKLWRIE